MAIIKVIRNIIFLLFVSIFIGTVLLMLVYSLPIKKQEQNVKESIKIFEDEGTYPVLLENILIRMHPENSMELKTILLNNRSMARDNYTDAIMLANACYAGTQGVLVEAMRVNRYENDENPVASLTTYAHEGSDELGVVSYERYWHGYLVVLKPLLLLLNYEQIRWVNVVIQLILLTYLLSLIYRKVGKKEAAIFFYALLFIMPIVIPFCMQYSTMYYIMLVSLIIMLKKKEWLFVKDRMLFYFFMIGIITSYIDFLTYPLVSLGIPLTMYFVLKKQQVGLKNVKDIILHSFFWGAGYVLMWGSKWILASIVLERNIIGDSIRQVAYRASSVPDWGDMKISSFHAILSNMSNYTNIFYLILIFTGVGFVGYQILKRPKDKKEIKGIVLSYSLLIIMPFVWYALFKNHSYGHGSFTYRSLMITVYAGITMLSNCYSERS